MNYWWASQNKNFRSAIPNGTLWTRPRIDGVLPAERKALQKLAVDDVVFHYGAPYLRAVSLVAAPAIDYPRPPDYPRGEMETEANDDGKLARVELIAVNLTLHRDQVAELISWGSPGPLSKHGVPREAYISPLTASDAAALLRALRIDVPNPSLPGRPHEDWAFGNGVTDAESVARVRKEQGALRAHLLRGARVASCAICGRDVPSALLIAGHIIPRSELTDDQRRRFDSVAMLVCLLGCDALFELGYVVVDQRGVTAAGRPTEDRTVLAEVAGLIGRHSPGWNSDTAATFKRHELRHTSGSN